MQIALQHLILEHYITKTTGFSFHQQKKKKEKERNGFVLPNPFKSTFYSHIKFAEQKEKNYAAIKRLQF